MCESLWCSNQNALMTTHPCIWITDDVPSLLSVVLRPTRMSNTGSRYWACKLGTSIFDHFWFHLYKPGWSSLWLNDQDGAWVCMFDLGSEPTETITGRVRNVTMTTRFWYHINKFVCVREIRKLFRYPCTFIRNDSRQWDIFLLSDPSKMNTHPHMEKNLIERSAP